MKANALETFNRISESLFIFNIFDKMKQACLTGFILL